VADPGCAAAVAYQGLVRCQALPEVKIPNRSYMEPLEQSKDEGDLHESDEDMLRRTRFIEDTCNINLQFNFNSIQDLLNLE